MLARQFIPILVCVLVLSNPSVAQTKQEEIHSIRVTFNRINEEKHFAIKKLENEEYLDHTPDGGGELSGYYKGDTLCKMTDWIGLSNGVVKDEYYFDKGKLIFIYEVESRFKYSDSLAEFDYSKQKVVFECRYYIQYNRLIQAIKTGKSLRGYSISDVVKVNELLDRAKKYASLLKTDGRRG